MKLWTDKTTFGGGELSPTMARRSDTQQHQDGAKRLRNVRLLNAGGVTRRPGSLDLLGVPAGSRLVEFTFSITQEYLLVLSAGRMDAYLTDGTAAGSLTGCPWSADDVWDLTWVQAGDTVVLACRAWAPQTIQRYGVAEWRRTPWTPDEGPGGALQQPYTKLANPQAKVSASDYTGTITLTADMPSFHPSHVGLRLRYAGTEVEITQYIDEGKLAGKVLNGRLPPSQRLHLDNITGFRTGHIIEGRNSAAKGEVVAVGTLPGTIDVLVTEGGWGFSADEEVDGPLSKATLNSIDNIPPLFVRDWDEPYISPVHGYPGAVGLHRARLWFGGHTRLPASVLASRVGNHYDFDPGTGEDGEAIFEDLGDAAVAWVRHFASAEHLLILTDQGPYYVPETPANPLRPSSITFHKIGAHGCGGVRPASFDAGVIHTHIAGAAMMDIRPTGDSTQSWKADDVALLASHLVRSPVDMAATHGRDGAPERYAMIVNGDGTLAVMHSIQSQQVLGWSLWETDGAYRSVAVLGGIVYALVERAFGDETQTRLERFDQALTTDGAVTLPTGTGAAPLLAGLTVHARSGTSYLGTVTIGPAGEVEGIDTDGDPLEMGRLFTPTIETLPPEPKLPYGGGAARVRRISRIRIYVLDALRVRCADRIMETHRIAEDVTAAPPARTEWIEAGMLGRSQVPTVTITQDEPLPMTILGVSMEVII